MLYAKVGAQTNPYPDTLWIPVIFYDYWIDNSRTNPDFEIAQASNTTGMVATTLDAQRKPVMTSVACPADPPLACHLNEWFRVSGKGGSDATCLFKCDSSSALKQQRWFWTTATGGQLTPYLGRVGEYVGPNYDSTYNMRNVIIYDSLPFQHLGRTNPALVGVYEYRNDAFFRLDSRGYGIQPAGSGHNFGFTMELHTTFKYKQGLTFNFRGDDDVWAFVNNKLAIDLGGRHAAATGSVNLDTLGLATGTKYNFDFFYAERHTTMSEIEITTNIITPEPKVLKLSVTNDSICAGVPKTIIGSVLDQDGNVMYPESDSIRWSIDPATFRRGDSVLVPMNDSTKITGTRAWRSFKVIASFRDLKDTATISVKACTPAYVDIVQQNTSALTQAQVLNTVMGSMLWDTIPHIPMTVTLDSTLTRMYVYAILRDKYGNFVQLANASIWNSRNTDTATVVGTAGKLFEGVIDRVSGARNGTTWVIDSQAALTPDSVRVVLRSDRIIALRLVSCLDTSIHLDTVRINTDQSQCFRLLGIWSTDRTHWVDVTGYWSTIPANSLPSTIPVPTTETGSWQFDPTAADTAVLRVTNGTVHVDAQVFVTEAPPRVLTLVLLTNPDSCIAGKPIKIGAYIQNLDGPVLGSYTGSDMYHDMLDNSKRPLTLPWLSVNPPAVDSLDKLLNETWLNGADTISLVLYYAPLAADSMHQIQLTLNTGVYGALTAKTIPFRLHPGPIDSVQIEDSYKTHRYNVINLDYQTNSSISLFAVGFDQYGNRIDMTIPEGSVLNNAFWSTDTTGKGTLDSLRQPQFSTGQNILYTAQNVTYDEAGTLWVTLTIGTKTLKDKVPVHISSAPATLDSAITRDINGNGLIDRIDLVFDKDVTISKDATGSFKIKFQSGGTTYTFTADSIVQISGNSYAVYIQEQYKTIPQTNWRPTVSITGLPGVQDISNLRALDGCPPVIWKVVKHISSADRATDTVRVYLSERIDNPDGSSPYNLNNQPQLTFYVWTKTDTGWVLQSTMLAGITTFSKIDTSTVCFVMTNGNDLTTSDYLNIIATNRPLKDGAGNYPAADNQRVPVTLDGHYIDITIFPNPSAGTLVRKPAGTLLLGHEPNARTWVQTDHAGLVISLINVPVPPAGSGGSVRGDLKIYDVIGNVVNSAHSDSVLSNIPNHETSGTQVDIYWNGSNARGMMVAPGVYRIVVYLQYLNYPSGMAPKNTRLIKKAGISR